MFENFKVFETELAGRPLVIETGKMAQLAKTSGFSQVTLLTASVTA